MKVDFPLTRFICDLILHGKPEVRKRYAAGKYQGINPSHAVWFAEVTR